MNYPVWEPFMLGGGLVIGVIAILHVFVSHFVSIFVLLLLAGLATVSWMLYVFYRPAAARRTSL